MRSALCFLLVAFLFGCQESARKVEVSKTDTSATVSDYSRDSLFLEEFLQETKLNFLDPDSYTGKDSIDWHVVDSLLNELRVSGFEGSLHYAPDTAFKIFVVSYEGCGAYCNPAWEYRVYARDNTPLVLGEEVDFSNIEEIYKLSDGKYMVLEDYSGRPASVLTEHCLSFNVYKTSHDSLLLANNFEISDSLQEPLAFDAEAIENYLPRLCQENEVDLHQTRTYDPLKEEVQFEFGKSFAYCCELDTIIAYKGTLKYQKGIFRLVSLQKKGYKPDY